MSLQIYANEFFLQDKRLRFNSFPIMMLVLCNCEEWLLKNRILLREIHIMCFLILYIPKFFCHSKPSTYYFYLFLQLFQSTESRPLLFFPFLNFCFISLFFKICSCHSSTRTSACHCTLFRSIFICVPFSWSILSPISQALGKKSPIGFRER